MGRVGRRVGSPIKTELVQRFIVAVEQRRVQWPAGSVQGSGFRVEGGGRRRIGRPVRRERVLVG
jgi:hypothetical protein